MLLRSVLALSCTALALVDILERLLRHHLADRLALETDPVRLVHDAVENRVVHGWVGAVLEAITSLVNLKLKDMRARSAACRSGNEERCQAWDKQTRARAG